MKLTFEQIVSCANGIIRVEQNELGLELHRFTREQEGFFYKTHPLFCKESFFNGYFGRNCRCGAGITLDFVSDATSLKMQFGQTEYAKSKKEFRFHYGEAMQQNTVEREYLSRPQSQSQKTAATSHRPTKYEIFSFGEILWDVFGNEAHLGGAPLNFAAFCAALGMEAELLSAVGDDELGARALEVVRALGVGTKHVAILSGKKTGQCLVTLNEQALPSYNLLDDVAYDYITPPREDAADVLAFGTLSLRREHNKETLAAILRAHAFSEVFVDLNVRLPFTMPESIRLALSYATILKFSDEEMGYVSNALDMACETPEQLAKDICLRFPQIRQVLVTKGACGSFCYTPSGDTVYCDAVKTEVVSTVGAGDSFGATFLCEYLKGLPIPSCLAFASKVSAIVCSRKEAVPADIGKRIDQIR